MHRNARANDVIARKHYRAAGSAPLQRVPRLQIATSADAIVRFARQNARCLRELAVA